MSSDTYSFALSETKTRGGLLKMEVNCMMQCSTNGTTFVRSVTEMQRAYLDAVSIQVIKYASLRRWPW